MTTMDATEFLDGLTLEALEARADGSEDATNVAIYVMVATLRSADVPDAIIYAAVAAAIDAAESI